MAEKRDYYEVLGVAKNAEAAEIKKLIGSSLYNIILTETREIKKQRKNLKKRQRLMMY